MNWLNGMMNGLLGQGMPQQGPVMPAAMTQNAPQIGGNIVAPEERVGQINGNNGGQPPVLPSAPDINVDPSSDPMSELGSMKQLGFLASLFGA